MPGPGVPSLPDETWKTQAACRDMDPTDFTPEDGEGEESPRLLDIREVCHACPVETDCLVWALKTKQPTGVWGGLTATEREATRPLRRGRKRG